MRFFGGRQKCPHNKVLKKKKKKNTVASLTKKVVWPFLATA
jgi:hypothetical protein